MHILLLHVVGVHAFVFAALEGCVATEVVQARLGQDVMLPCTHQHSLEDVILVQWIKLEEGQRKLLANLVEGKIKQPGSPRYHVSSNFSFTIRSISSTDGGIYQCRVVTPQTDTTGTIHEVILHIYATSSETVKGFVGESVKFVCPPSGEASYHTSVTWTKYSHDMSHEHILFESDVSLTIDVITPNEEGVYECNRTAAERAAGVLHAFNFHVFAKPATSPHIDGCRNDGVKCKQEIHVGTNAFFTCRADNIYPEAYPTWSEEKEYREKVTNTDGTFNTASSIIVNGTDIQAEKVCTFVMEGFNASSHLLLKALQLSDNDGVSTSVSVLAILLSATLCAALYCTCRLRMKSLQLERYHKARRGSGNGRPCSNESSLYDRAKHEDSTIVACQVDEAFSPSPMNPCKT